MLGTHRPFRIMNWHGSVSKTWPFGGACVTPNGREKKNGTCKVPTFTLHIGRKTFTANERENRGSEVAMLTQGKNMILIKSDVGGRIPSFEAVWQSVL
jgi:hypothetical protein